MKLFELYVFLGEWVNTQIVTFISMGLFTQAIVYKWDWENDKFLPLPFL